MRQIGVPSRRVDPIRYARPDADRSSLYATERVSSGHHAGSKIGAPKASASAPADLYLFEVVRVTNTAGPEPEAPAR